MSLTRMKILVRFVFNISTLEIMEKKNISLKEYMMYVFHEEGMTIKPIIHVHCCSSSESKLMTDTAWLDLVWIILFKLNYFHY